MPRKAIDYSKSLVYRIAYKDTTYYVGSTTNFRNRKNQHKSNCRNVKNKKYNIALYKFIRETGGWNDEWVMILVQSYPNCKSSKELRKYEREHYDILKPELNMCKPCLKEGEKEEQKKQYCAENSVTIKEYQKQYNKEYREENFEKLKELSQKYYTENAETIKNQSKQYKANNADKIREQNKIKHNCKCGGNFSHNNESRHNKTEKHINYLNKLSTNIING